MKLLLTFLIAATGIFFAQPKTYVDALRSYNGTAYLEETCSALICQAHDRVSKKEVHCTAKELWAGCDGNLEKVTEAESLKKLDWSKVKPGDVLAVNGVHVVAYLGNGQCIDSAPLQGGVAEVSADELEQKIYDPWFNGPVRVERWLN
ncbi:MAG: C40 family peptidase [Acidobacteria bacterium]|nr:C40 family peptidase [Acidobacteriota bacterium]MBS1865630.1 C40 family peptidase [Acidobacteriota bacterium]